MKKLLYYLTCIIFISLILSACSKDDVNKEKKIKIVATIFPQYDFVKRLTDGVDGLEVTMLISPGVDVHNFEPTTKNVKEISDADLLIYTGGKNDLWLDKIFKSVEKKKDSLFSLMNALEIDKDDAKNKDEHVWTSLLNCKQIVEKLAIKLGEIDKKNSKKYNDNMKKYISEIDKLHNEFKNLVANSKRKLVVFGDKCPFYYFSKDYGLEFISPYSGCSSKVDVNSKEITNIVRKIKQNNIPVVLKLENGNSQVAAAIAKEANIPVRTFYSCHNSSKKDFEKGTSFLSYIDKNLKTLKEAISV